MSSDKTVSSTVYTRVDGKLACFKVCTDDIQQARHAVMETVSQNSRIPVLGLITSPIPATIVQ